MSLQINSRGEEVEKMQTKLGIQVDGEFGLMTMQALKDYQANNDLKVDGILGDETRALLFANEADKTHNDLGNLKLSQLEGHLPNEVIKQIPDCTETFKINTPLRLAHFLAQCSHESADFKATEENLNYSVSALKRVFKKYFRGNLAEKYAHQPEKIASRVYGGRMGNGKEASKEGYKYRGRGYIQLTGKNNYSAFNEVVEEDVVASPELVATKYALLSAAWYWDSRALNNVADKGTSKSTSTIVTKKVNGGRNGLADRIRKFKKYYSLLSD
jgi:putative chitinase